MALTGVSDNTRKKQEELQNPTASVTEAQKAAADYKANNDPTNSKYGMVAEELLDEYLNRGDFKYDVNGDALYAQYKDQYTKNAQKAMKDTVAQSAAYTGGYSNSWGQTAGQQVYQDYMTELDNMIPELRQQAYNEYLAEGEALLNKYGVSQGHYQDLLDQFRTERDYLDNKAEAEYAKWLEERGYWDGVASSENSDYWTGKNFDESVRQYDEQFAYQKQQDAITNAQNERSIAAQEAAASAPDAYDYYQAEKLYKTGGETALREFLLKNGYDEATAEEIAMYAMGSTNVVTDRAENKDGTITYTFADGTNKTLDKGVNPYTLTANAVDPSIGLEDDESYFMANGYQPKYLNGEELKDSGRTVTVAGRKQKVWNGENENGDDEQYVWLGYFNQYITYDEYKANEEYYNNLGGSNGY